MSIGRAENSRDVEIQNYIKQLQDKRVDIRIDAASVLKEIGLDSSDTKILPALIAALKDPYPEVRINAARAIKDIAPNAQQAVPALAEVLKDKNEQVAKYAAEALAEIGSGAEHAIPALIKTLDHRDDHVQVAAGIALKNIGLSASEQLLAALNDPRQSWRVHRGAILALSGMCSLEKELIPRFGALFADKKQDWRVRQEIALKSFHNMGSRAKAAVPVLVEGLRDEKMQIRQGAARALGGIGVNAKEAIPELLKILQNRQEALVVRAQSAYALGGIGSVEKDDRIVPALVTTLQEEDWGVRYHTVGALGKIGRENVVPLLNHDVVQKLVERLEDPNSKVQKHAIDAITQLSEGVRMRANQLTEAQIDKAIAQLETAQDGLQQKSDRIEQKNLTAVQEALTLSRQEKSSRISQNILKWGQQNPCFLAIPVLLIGYLGLLWLRPGLLLLLPSELTISKIGIKLPPPVLLRLKFRPRTLDAWVASHLEIAQENFNSYATVKEREIHIPISVTLGTDENSTPLTVEAIRPTFAKKQGRLLIVGEGGSGKTSLACQIAQWATESNPWQRLCSHPMLPVLIEQEPDFATVEDKDPFQQAIKEKLHTLIGEAVPDELLEQLLRQRRILVIVDHLSEMSEQARNTNLI